MFFLKQQPSLPSLSRHSSLRGQKLPCDPPSPAPCGQRKDLASPPAKTYGCQCRHHRGRRAGAGKACTATVNNPLRHPDPAGRHPFTETEAPGATAPLRKKREAQGTAWPGRQQPFIYFTYLCLFIYLCNAISLRHHRQYSLFIYLYGEAVCVCGGRKGFSKVFLCISRLSPSVSLDGI